MSAGLRVVVFAGGTSAEREVSLGSGRPVAAALARSFPTRLAIIDGKTLPADLDPSCDIVCSTLHGTFGEDGGMQRLLDAAGVHYAGCDAASSALTFDKALTKRIVAEVGVRVADGWTFAAEAAPAVDEIVARLGEAVAIKPNASGSSVGLALTKTAGEIDAALAKLTAGEWIIERRLIGREITVGVLNGRAMGVVEIAPKSGVFDYSSKYTKGLTEYLAPAPISAELTVEAQAAAERAFAACGCRDYARIDFIITRENELFMLEINTLPGMKETSLLPMSAGCVGLDFVHLVEEMVKPAARRLREAQLSRNPA